MNPWWRRPAAEEKQDERRDGAQPVEGSAGGEEQPQIADAVEAAAAPAPGSEPGDDAPAAAKAAAKKPDAAPAKAAAKKPDAAPVKAAAKKPDAAPAKAAAKKPDVTPAEETAKGDGPTAEMADELSAQAAEPAVSAALEAATEPAEPAQAAAAEPADTATAAPPKRRRRRRRRGRRSRRGRGGGVEAREQGEAGDVAPARPDAVASPIAEESVALRPAATETMPAMAARAAALLDLGSLERSLEGAPELDPEGLLARLDGEFGKLVLRRVYADASDRRLDRGALHGAGVEVVDVPSGADMRACSAAVRIVVDALELCYTKRGVRTVVLAATSVQLLPLVAKLQQNGVTVIGLGGAAGDAQVRAQCDRFIDLSGQEPAS